MNTSPAFVFVLFGCFISKRIPVPIPVEKSTSRYSRLNAVLSDCSPSLLFCEDRAVYAAMNLSRFEAKEPKVVIWEEQSSDGCAEFDRKTVRINANSVALIQYTSGSMSDPKGVVLTHKNILDNIEMIKIAMRITPDDKVVSWLPLHHDMGLIGMLVSLRHERANCQL